MPATQDGTGYLDRLRQALGKPAPAASPTATTSTEGAKDRLARWAKSFGVPRLPDIDLPFMTSVTSLGIFDPVEELFRELRVGSSISLKTDERIGGQLKHYLDDRGIIRTDVLDELASAQPAVGEMLKSLRQVKAQSEIEAARRTPEEIDRNLGAMLTTVHSMVSVRPLRDEAGWPLPESRESRRERDLDAAFVADELGVPAGGPFGDWATEATPALAVRGVHLPALTDDDIAAEITSAIKGDVSLQYNKWRQESPYYAMTADVAASTPTFIPLMRGASMLTKLAGLHRFTSRAAATARVAGEMGAVDLAMQGLQVASGASKEVDLTRAALAGIAGGFGHVASDALLHAMLAANVRKVASGELAAASSEQIQAAAIARTMSTFVGRHAPSITNLGAYDLSLRGLDVVRHKLSRAEELPPGEERDWMVETYGVLLNALLGFVDSSTRSDASAAERARVNMISTAQAAEARATSGARAAAMKRAGVSDDPTVPAGEVSLAAAAEEVAAKDPPPAAPEAPRVAGKRPVVADDPAADAAPLAAAETPTKTAAEPTPEPAPEPEPGKGRAAPPPAGAQEAGIKVGGSLVRYADVDSIDVRADEMQFKSGTGQGGVIPEERLGGVYEHEPARPLLVWEDASGRMVVVDGHHRLDLAKRNGVKRVLVNIVREADGTSKEDARALGAIANIRDGTGKIEDYARFFRNRGGMTREQAERAGLLARDKGKAGWSLGRDATPRLYDAFLKGEIGESAARAIAESAPGKDGVQEVALKRALEGKVGVDELRAMTQYLDDAAKMPATDKTRAEQGGLFGGVDESERVMREGEVIGRAVGEITRDLRDKVAAGKGAARRPEKARALGVDVSDPAKTKAEVSRLEGELADWREWVKNPELVDVARERAGLPAFRGREEMREQRHARERGEQPGGLFGPKATKPQPAAAPAPAKTKAPRTKGVAKPGAADDSPMLPAEAFDRVDRVDSARRLLAGGRTQDAAAELDVAVRQGEIAKDEAAAILRGEPAREDAPGEAASGRAESVAVGEDDSPGDVQRVRLGEAEADATTSSDAHRSSLVSDGAPKEHLDGFDQIAGARSGLPQERADATVVDSLLARGVVEEIYDRSGRTRLIVEGGRVPRGWSRVGEQLGPAPVHQAEAARSALNAVRDGAVVMPDGVTAEGDAAEMVVDQINDGTLKIRTIKKIGKEQGSYEVTTADGQKIKLLVGSDAYRHVIDSVVARYKAEKKKKGERGAVLIALSYTPAERRILDKQHRAAQSFFGLVARRGVLGAVRGAARSIDALAGTWSTREKSAAITEKFRSMMGWFSDPKLEPLVADLQRVEAAADRGLGQLFADLGVIVRSTKNGELLMRDAFDLLEGLPPQELTVAEPGGRRNPKTKEMNPPPEGAKLADRPGPRLYDRPAAQAVARIVERIRERFADAGEKLVELRRMAEEVRDEGAVDAETNEPVMTVYYRGDMPPPAGRKGRLVGGYNFWRDRYAPHTMDPALRRRRVAAAAFAEHAIRNDNDGIPLFSKKAANEAEHSYLRQRKLTREEWARLGGIRDIRAVFKTLRHQTRLGAQLEFFATVGKDAAWVVHDEPPDLTKIRGALKDEKAELARHQAWMRKKRIPVAMGVPSPPDMIRRRAKLERTAIRLEQFFDEAGLPEHGLPAGWALDPKDPVTKQLLEIQSSLKRIRSRLWGVSNTERPADSMPAQTQAANRRLQEIRDRIFALQRQTDGGWEELTGRGWGPLNEYGLRKTWMRADIFNAQAERATHDRGWAAVWSSYLTIAKAAVTSENPATQLGNAISNLFTNNFAGVRMSPFGLSNYVGALRALWQHHHGGAVANKHAKEWIERGGLQIDSLTADEFKALPKSLREWIAEPFNAEGGGNMIGTVQSLAQVIHWMKRDAPIVSKVFTGARKLYSFSDQVGELALYMSARSGVGFARGQLDADVAWQMVADHYNQREIAPWAKGYAGRKGLVPFISWLYKNVGAIPRHMMLRDATSLWADVPARVAASPFKGRAKELVRSGVAMGMSTAGYLAKTWAAWSVMHHVARSSAGLSEEEYDEALIERARGDTWRKFLQVPVWIDSDEPDAKKRPLFLDAVALTPYGQMMKMTDAPMNPADNRLTAVLRMNPLTSGVLDGLRGTDFFGREIKSETGRLLHALVRPLAPGLVRATAEMNWQRHPGLEGIARALGIKIERADVDKLREALRFEMLREGVDLEWVRTPQAKTLKGMLEEQAHAIRKIRMAVKEGRLKELLQPPEWVRSMSEGDDE